MSTHWVGSAGILLVLVAFLPQIFHLVKEHCAAGISVWAFSIWWVASLLLLAHALGINDGVFIVLQCYQVLANTVIVLYAKRYEHALCEHHIKDYEDYLNNVGRNPGDG